MLFVSPKAHMKKKNCNSGMLVKSKLPSVAI